MRRNIGETGLVLASVFLLSYVLNYVWESLHAVFLYEAHDFPARKYVRMVSYVSAVDGALVTGLYLFTGALWRDLRWLRSMNRRQAYALFICGMIVAAAIEYQRVYVSKTWGYGPLMPTVFGIGISPLVQLSVTGLLAFWLTRRLLYQRGMYFRCR